MQKFKTRKTFVREDASGSFHRSRTGRVQRGGSPAQPRQPLFLADTSMKFPCWSAPWGSTMRTPSSTAPADRTMRSIMSGSGCPRGLRTRLVGIGPWTLAVIVSAYPRDFRLPLFPVWITREPLDRGVPPFPGGLTAAPPQKFPAFGSIKILGFQADGHESRWRLARRG